jgi:Na+/pantothenate symporter
MIDLLCPFWAAMDAMLRGGAKSLLRICAIKYKCGALVFAVIKQLTGYRYGAF